MQSLQQDIFNNRLRQACQEQYIYSKYYLGLMGHLIEHLRLFPPLFSIILIKYIFLGKSCMLRCKNPSQRKRQAVFRGTIAYSRAGEQCFLSPATTVLHKTRCVDIRSLTTCSFCSVKGELHKDSTLDGILCCFTHDRK